MFDKLKRFLQGELPPAAATLDDPALGSLTWSKDDEAWLTSPAHQGTGFAFHLTGTPRPHPALLCHAADILRQRDEFNRAVRECLAREAATVRHLAPYRDEISGLKIETVCLFWPDRPDDGMIFLEGGRDYRGWRCDYVGRKPVGLGFDT